MTTASSDATPKLSAALVKAQAEMRAVGKGGENTYDHYKYATLEDYVRLTRPIMAKHGLSLTYSVDALEHLEKRTTSGGKTEYPVVVKATARLEHESGDARIILCVGEGQDRADKGIYKAITGMRKYAIACIFNLATSDDPEADPKVGVDDKPGAVRKPTPPKTAMTDFRSRKVALYKTLVAKRGEANSSMTGQEVMIAIIDQELGKKTIDNDAELTKVANAIDNGDYELDEAMKLPGTSRPREDAK